MTSREALCPYLNEAIEEFKTENKRLNDDIRYLREENLSLKEDLCEKEL